MSILGQPGRKQYRAGWAQKAKYLVARLVKEENQRAITYLEGLRHE